MGPLRTRVRVPGARKCKNARRLNRRALLHTALRVAALPSAGREHDGVNHRHDAAFGLREAQPVEGRDHAADHAAVRKIRATVGGVGNCAVTTDNETRRNTPFEVGIATQALLVTHTEPTVVLTDDALNYLGRETTAHGRCTHAHLGGLGLMGSAKTAMASAEALPCAGTGSVAQGADVAQADAFAATTAALTDTGETEAARAERVADFVAPHVTAGAHVIRAERCVATPRRRWGVRVTGCARIEQADHAELSCLAQRCLTSDVWIRVV